MDKTNPVNSNRTSPTNFAAYIKNADNRKLIIAEEMNINRNLAGFIQIS